MFARLKNKKNEGQVFGVNEFGYQKREDLPAQPVIIKTTYTRDELLETVKEGLLVLPEGMEKIENRMFEGCEQIKSVVVPGSVTFIGTRAFAKCQNLKSILLQHGIETIETNVFTDCPRLKNVQLPPSIQKVEGRTFYRSGLNEPVFSADGKVLVYYPQEWNTAEYTVPEGVEVIGSYAFMDAVNLMELRLNNGLKRIEQKAFINCGFKEIRIPSGVKIARGAFSYFSHEPEIHWADQYATLEKKLEFCCCLNQPFLHRQQIQLPAEEYWKEEPFRMLAQRCSEGNAAAMDEMSEFFAGMSAKETENMFCHCAAQFWRVRAYLYGSEKARTWLENWIEAHPKSSIVSPYLDETLCGSSYGKALNALGFLFFSKGGEYSLAGVDDDGVVEVSSYESEDGPDEDGFGREEYYDWWYLDEHLNLPQGVGYLHRYSHLARRNNQKTFLELHDKVAGLSRKRNT